MSQIQPISRDITFLFDIIVTNIHTQDAIENPQKLTVTVKINKVSVNITASRINVSEFQAGRRTEFKAQPGALRESLQTIGMPLVVRYSGRTLGNTDIMFPQTFIDRIEVGMGELQHADAYKIINRGKEVGVVELLCSLNIKCDEPVGDFDAASKRCANLGKEINPTDIMFLFGQQEPCSVPSQPCLDDLQPEEGDERLKLDLDRYRQSNERVTQPTDEICGMEACCQLKTMTTQYEKLIDSVIKKMTQLPSPLPDDNYQLTDLTGKQTTSKDNYEYIERTIPVPVGDFEEMGIKPIRFCPVCLTPMSWLPKYAPCPNCAAKAMPQIEERSEDRISATKVMQEYLKLPSAKNEDFCDDPCADKEPDSKTTVCTCKLGQLCVHCRIRNLCGEIINPKKDEYRECPAVQPAPDEDFCVIVEPGEKCRPYLERVFCELRDLYDKRDAEKKAELKKRCSQSLFTVRQNNSSHDAAELVEPSMGAMLKAPGPPTFLSRVPHGPKIGHRTCLKRRDFVSRRHGWAWPSSKEARMHGWRPGAISRYAGTVMRFFLQCAPENDEFNTCRRVENEEKEKERQLPILNVCKKNGAIFITLRGIKSPHGEMKPIIFKIVKSDLAVALRKIKKKLKRRGFRKCTCHKSLMMCVCREKVEKKHLERALQKECKRRRMENCVDHLVLTDTTDSEMEFDFNVTPPGVVQPLPSIKARTANHTTQTAKKDLEVLPKYPKKLTPFWRAYDCAAGDRYTGTAFGLPGENVFEDGVFGYRGGGPHGESATPGGRLKCQGTWGGDSGGAMRGVGRFGTGGGFGGGIGGKSFPGAKKTPGKPSEPIPVRMTQRFYKAAKDAVNAEKEALKIENERKKKGTDMMKYLMKQGSIAAPWNPNDPKPKGPKVNSGPVLGPDGLTDAQRKRRTLQQMPIPPLDTLARLGGKGIDPCAMQCYNPCAALWYNPCGYNC